MYIPQSSLSSYHVIPLSFHHLMSPYHFIAPSPSPSLPFSPSRSGGRILGRGRAGEGVGRARVVPRQRPHERAVGGVPGSPQRTGTRARASGTGARARGRRQLDRQSVGADWDRKTTNNRCHHPHLHHYHYCESNSHRCCDRCHEISRLCALAVCITTTTTTTTVTTSSSTSNSLSITSITTNINDQEPSSISHGSDADGRGRYDRAARVRPSGGEPVGAREEVLAVRSLGGGGGGGWVRHSRL